MTTKKPSKKPLTKEQIKKIVKRHNRFTARQNAAFDAMTKPEKRVRIAQDVLDQIRTSRIIPTSGIYLTNMIGKGDSPGASNSVLYVSPQEVDKEISEVFAKMKSCNACALGSVFVCAVDRADKLKLKDLYGEDELKSSDQMEKIDISEKADQSEMHEYLKKFFSLDQLEAIEAAFECDESDSKFNSYDYNNIDDDTLRLERVMKNIIRHKGTFKANDKGDLKSLKQIIAKQQGVTVEELEKEAAKNGAVSGYPSTY